MSKSAKFIEDKDREIAELKGIINSLRGEISMLQNLVLSPGERKTENEVVLLRKELLSVKDGHKMREIEMLNALQGVIMKYMELKQTVSSSNKVLRRASTEMKLNRKDNVFARLSCDNGSDLSKVRNAIRSNSFTCQNDGSFNDTYAKAMQKIDLFLESLL